MQKTSDYPGFVRVTEALSIYSGIDKVPEKYLVDAKERGDKVHEIFTAMMNHLGVIETFPNYSGYIKSLESWIKDKEFIERPPRLFCDKYKITGEVDGIYKNPNGLTLFDIKTSQKINKTFLLQLSAYAYLCRLLGLNITKIECVQLLKDGSPAVSFFYEENLELFLECLKLYRYFFSK